MFARVLVVGLCWRAACGQQECRPGFKLLQATKIRVAASDAYSLSARCWPIERPECVHECVWRRSCRETNNWWHFDQGARSYVGGLRYNEVRGDLDVNCCTSLSSLMERECQWTSVKGDQDRTFNVQTMQAELGFNPRVSAVIRDVITRRAADGQLQVRLEVCGVQKERTKCTIDDLMTVAEQRRFQTLQLRANRARFVNHRNVQQQGSLRDQLFQAEQEPEPTTTSTTTRRPTTRTTTTTRRPKTTTTPARRRPKSKPTSASEDSEERFLPPSAEDVDLTDYFSSLEFSSAEEGFFSSAQPGSAEPRRWAIPEDELAKLTADADSSVEDGDRRWVFTESELLSEEDYGSDSDEGDDKTTTTTRSTTRRPFITTTSAQKAQCPKKNWQQCVTDEQANLRFGWCCNSLPDICKSICNYDIAKRDLVRAAVGRKSCPREHLKTVANCAADYKDATQCCEETGVLRGKLRICRPLCNPLGVTESVRSAKMLPCLDQIQPIMSCFKAYINP